ncbi:MAG: CPBP family intramembrane metalloprotease [Bacteroidetes bacterium]|nr:MAG: CPBP family intramembrane metalloprotease [Bacteroidota bacterium]
MNTRKVGLYLAFSFGISWAIAAVLYLLSQGEPNQIVMMVASSLFMWGPALAVLIVQKGFYKESLAPYGWTFKRLNGIWLLLSLAVPLVIFLLYLGTVALLGNGLGLPGMGTVDLSREGLIAQIELLAAQAGQPANTGGLTSLPLPGWLLLLVMMLAAVIPGASLNAFFAFGEELGWRGLMQEETRSLGFWRSNLLIGIVWGIWHSPLLLMGHNYGDSGWLGIPVMAAFCVGMSFVMGYLAQRTGSIIGPSMLHGVVNAVAGFSILYVHGSDPLIGGVAGLAGAVPALLLTLGLLRDKSRLAAWAGASNQIYGS